MNITPKAIVLLSGGLDSTTVMAIAKHAGFEIYSLSFYYGQRHSFELEAAHKVAEAFGVQEHLAINSDLRKIGGSALTDDIDVPKARTEASLTTRDPRDICSGQKHRFSCLCPSLGRSPPIIRHIYRRQCDRLQRLPGLPA